MILFALRRRLNFAPGLVVRCLTKKAQRINRSNLAQPIDVNTLETLISRATTPSALAWPLLRFLPFLNARQTTAMLQKMPRLEALHQRRYQYPHQKRWGGDQDQQKAYEVLMRSLASRFSEVMKDCSTSQMQQGLWGLAMWSSLKIQALPDDEEIRSKIASTLTDWLQALSPSQHSPPLLSHAAWYVSATGPASAHCLEPIASLIVEHDARASPSSTSSPTSTSPASSNPPPRAYSKKREMMEGQLSYSQRMFRGGEGGPDGSLGREISLPHPSLSSTLIDHRSLLRMAWAFRSQKEAFAPVWDVISRHATRSLTQIIEQHDKEGGTLPLLPRKHYVYKTLREKQMRLETPRPYRESKYLIHSGLPHVSIVSFDIRTVASLVTSMALAGHRDESCLRAIERFVVASLPLPSSDGASSSSSSSTAEEALVRPVAKLSDSGPVPFKADESLVRPVLKSSDSGPVPFKSSFDFNASSLAPVLGGYSPPPLKAGSILQGTAKPMISSSQLPNDEDGATVDLKTASRLLGSFYSLGYKSTEMAQSVLFHLSLKMRARTELDQATKKRLEEIEILAKKL